MFFSYDIMPLGNRTIVLSHWLAQANPEEDETSGLFFCLGIKIDIYIIVLS